MKNKKNHLDHNKILILIYRDNSEWKIYTKFIKYYYILLHAYINTYNNKIIKLNLILIYGDIYVYSELLTQFIFYLW